MKKLFFFFAAMLVTLAVSAQTDFAAPGYALTGSAAVLDDGLLKEDHFGVGREYIRYDGGNHGFAAASWTVTATRGCYVTAKVFTANNDWSSSSSPWGHSGHSFGVELWNEDATIRLDTVAEGVYALGGDGNRNYPAEGIDLTGTLLIPEAGVYTFKLLNPRYWSRCGVDSVLLTYSADAPTEIIEVSSVELNKTELALQVDEVEQLTATVLPENATTKTVTWESTDESVATVDGGFITAIAAGTATIKAKAGEKEATCAVTVAAAAVPEVKLTSTYTLEAKVAHLEGKIGKKYEGEKYKIYGKGNKVCGNAFWTIHVTNPCIISASIANANGDGAGSLCELDVFKGDDSITTVIQPAASKWYTGIIEMTGTMTLAEAGDYTFRLRNTQEYSVGKASGIMLTYVSAPPQTLYLKPGIWNVDGAKFAIWDITHSAWSEFMTPVENEIGIYTATIAGDATQVIYVRLNSSATAPDWDKKDNQTGDLNLEDGKDLLTITDWGTGTWSLFEPTPWVTGSNEKLKVFKEGDEPGVVSVQQPGWAAESGIYLTFPSAAWDKEKFSLPESKYATEGAGMVIYLSALDLKYNEISINCNNTDYKFTIYNVDGAETVYNVAGSSAIAFGTTWDTYANKMTLDEDLYKWEKTELELAAGEITFKVVKDHVWAKGAWPNDNYVLNIPASGIYTISITFNESTKEINATATKTGEAVILPPVDVKGDWDDWAAALDMTPATDKKSCSVTRTFDATGTYQFGIEVNGSWKSNGQECTFSRTNDSLEISGYSGNMNLDIDVAGEYTFTWYYETSVLKVTYPALPILYAEYATGHEGKADFADANGRILLTLRKSGNDIVVTVKNNNAAGNTQTGLNYLWVNATGATNNNATYGSHDTENTEEVSVTVKFDAAKDTYVFNNIHWAYAGFGGEWAIDNLTVKASELCNLNNGWYLVGTFNGEEEWGVENLTPAKKFAVNPENAEEFVVAANLKTGDRFKAVYVYRDEIQADSWKPSDGDGYVVTDWTAGAKDIFFRVNYYNTWGGHFYIAPNSTTAVDNTAVEGKAVKSIVNGQLLITRDGKTYNVLGTIVK